MATLTVEGQVENTERDDQEEKNDEADLSKARAGYTQVCKRCAGLIRMYSKHR